MNCSFIWSNILCNWNHASGFLLVFRHDISEIFKLSLYYCNNLGHGHVRKHWKPRLQISPRPRFLISDWFLSNQAIVILFHCFWSISSSCQLFIYTGFPVQLPFSVHRGGRGHEVRSYSVHIIYILQYTIMTTSSSGSKVSLEHCQGNLWIKLIEHRETCINEL
jgi:hypothetical protein